MNFLEIIQKRKAPGIILFNDQGNVVFFNEQTLKIIPDLKNPPDIIKQLYTDARNCSGSRDNVAVLNINQKQIYSLRTVILKDDSNHDNYIMILIEKIAEKRIDFNTVQTKYNLTDREMQVLKLVCSGFSNKKISEKLFISEYTVKDHLKKIMKKLNVSSRGEIIAFLIT
ncbi:response regulator transcription factor [Desulfovulcanus sp.]